MIKRTILLLFLSTAYCGSGETKNIDSGPFANGQAIKCKINSEWPSKNCDERQNLDWLYRYDSSDRKLHRYENKEFANIRDPTWRKTLIKVNCGRKLFGGSVIESSEDSGFLDRHSYTCFIKGEKKGVYVYLDGDSKLHKYADDKVATSWDENWEHAPSATCSKDQIGADLPFNFQDGHSYKCEVTGLYRIKLTISDSKSHFHDSLYRYQRSDAKLHRNGVYRFSSKDSRLHRYTDTETAEYWDKDWREAPYVKCPAKLIGSDLDLIDDYENDEENETDEDDEDDEDDVTFLESTGLPGITYKCKFTDDSSKNGYYGYAKISPETVFKLHRYSKEAGESWVSKGYPESAFVDKKPTTCPLSLYSKIEMPLKTVDNSRDFEDGKSYDCTTNGIKKGYYRYNVTITLLHTTFSLHRYPNPEIADSWDLNWKSAPKRECPLYLLGKDMEFKFLKFLDDRSYECKFDDASKNGFYRYAKIAPETEFKFHRYSDETGESWIGKGWREKIQYFEKAACPISLYSSIELPLMPPVLVDGTSYSCSFSDDASKNGNYRYAKIAPETEFKLHLYTPGVAESWLGPNWSQFKNLCPSSLIGSVMPFNYIENGIYSCGDKGSFWYNEGKLRHILDGATADSKDVNWRKAPQVDCPDSKIGKPIFLDEKVYDCTKGDRIGSFWATGGQLRYLANADIAQSYDPNWNNAWKSDCTGVTFGENMPQKAA